MDARQRLLDALAEVESKRSAYEKARGVGNNIYARDELWRSLYYFIPTLAALREVVEMHKRANAGSDAHPHEHPCPTTIRTLTRQFEEE